jgi:hypothetical protein
MHEEESRRFSQHMAVEGGYFNAATSQCPNDSIHFACEKYEVAGRHRSSAARWLNVDGGRNSHRRGNDNAIGPN